MHRFLIRLLLVIYCCLLGCQKEAEKVVPVKGHIDSLRDTAKRFQLAGDKKSALAYHYKVQALAKQLGMKEHQARTLVDIATLIREDSANRSMEHLYDALDIAAEIRHDRLRSDIYLAISETYKRQQNFREALKALDIHRKLVDSLVVQDKQRAMALASSQQHAQLQQTIGVSVVIVILLVLSVFIYYYRRLRRLNVKLKQLNGVKDQLFSVIGHDLRGPAGNLVQVLELLTDNSLSEEEKKEMTTALLRQSRAFYDTVETLFRWAHSQQHGIAINLQQFDPVEMIRHCLELLEGQAVHKGVQLQLKEMSPVLVVCDPDHFIFVMRNLVSNAIKFSVAGGFVTVSFEVSNGFAVFSVADAGIGMSVEQLKKLNSGRMDSTYGTAGEKGTGLGLQLAKRMIKANHGKLCVESTEGKGTLVLFSLPVAGVIAIG